MSQISSLAVLLAIVGAVLCGPHGKGGHHGGPGPMMGLGKEAEAVMCKPENMNDDKFDQFRTEMEACNVDECAAQADDITGVEKDMNKMMARMHCSEKYRTCHHEKMAKFHKGDGEEPDEETKAAMKEKWQAKKECLKAAFEKVFGPIPA